MNIKPWAVRMIPVVLIAGVISAVMSVVVNSQLSPHPSSFTGNQLRCIHLLPGTLGVFDENHRYKETDTIRSGTICSWDYLSASVEGMSESWQNPPVHVVLTNGRDRYFPGTYVVISLPPGFHWDSHTQQFVHN